MSEEVSNIRVNEGSASSAPSALEPMKDKRANELTVPDSLGRSITVRKSTPLDLFRLTKLYGAKATEATLNMAVAVTSVTAIDGDRIVPPGTDRQIEMLFERLGWEGFAAVGKALAKLNPDISEDGEELVKNS